MLEGVFCKFNKVRGAPMAASMAHRLWQYTLKSACLNRELSISNVVQRELYRTFWPLQFIVILYSHVLTILHGGFSLGYSKTKIREQKFD